MPRHHDTALACGAINLPQDMVMVRSNVPTLHPCVAQRILSDHSHSTFHILRSCTATSPALVVSPKAIGA